MLAVGDFTIMSVIAASREDTLSSIAMFLEIANMVNSVDKNVVSLSMRLLS